jgi:uncharacterized protein YkwD
MIRTKEKVGGYFLKFSALVCLFSITTFGFFLLQIGDSSAQKKEGLYSADQVLLEVNKKRTEIGLKPLILNKHLIEASKAKAGSMKETNYFSHVDPYTGKKWSDFIKESGYEYLEAGENLANGFGTVKDMVEAWMKSPSHKENILNKNVSETGVGVISGKLNGFSTVFVVQVFGEQESDYGILSEKLDLEYEDEVGSLKQVFIKNKEE